MLEEVHIAVWERDHGQWCWRLTLPSFRNTAFVGHGHRTRADALIDASDTLGRHVDTPRLIEVL